MLTLLSKDRTRWHLSDSSEWKASVGFREERGTVCGRPSPHGDKVLSYKANRNDLTLLLKDIIDFTSNEIHFSSVPQ